MPSAALTRGQNDRTPRLNEVEAHCAAVLALVPPNLTFLDETLRGYVLHLSAHFQGFCRNLDARGRSRIADFGQAHFSSDASPALGTFFYMAPEQADPASHIPDTRWDVYGLGALLYAMLTGHPPREDARLRDELSKTRELSHRLERYRQWVQKAPKPEAHRRVGGMDRSLAEIIDRCLEIDEGKRYRDAGAVLAALACRDRRQRRRPLG